MILFFTDNDSLMYEIESKSVYDDFSKNIGMLDFGNYSSKSKYFDDLDALFLGKTKDETDSLAIEELARLKPKVEMKMLLLR